MQQNVGGRPTVYGMNGGSWMNNYDVFFSIQLESMSTNQLVNIFFNEAFERLAPFDRI